MPSGLPRPGRVLGTVLAALAVLVVGVGAVGVIGYCSVFGCSLFAQTFEPRGDAASAARVAAQASAGKLVTGVVAGREVLAEASGDGCVTGQNDWKRQDTYSHDCSVVRSRLVVLTTDREGVAAALTALDATVRGLGCTPSYGGGLDRVRNEYWHEDNPMVSRYGAAGLPGAVYQCPDEATVEVRPTSRAEPSSEPDVVFGGFFRNEVLAQSWYTPDDVRALHASAAQLAVVVTVEEPYYRTRF